MAIHSLTGGLMESFFQVSEITLEGLVSAGAFLCFSRLVDIIYWAVYKEIWTENELNELENSICEYKAEFVSLYGHIKEKVRGGSTLFITLFVFLLFSFFPKWYTNYHFVILLIATVYVEKLLSFRFVNLEMLRHLGEMIRWLGSLIHQSSRLGEANHRCSKNVGQCTNKRFIERDILVKVSTLTSLL